MRYRQSLLPTLKEAPADATSASHILLLRAGFVRRVGAGIYSYLPLGVRVLRKIEGIVRDMLKPDGTFMIVEPRAGDRVEENLNPVGRLFYGASTVICTPASLAQEVGLALGAQAGEARTTQVIKQGGFTRVRRATETQFNLILEAMP